MSTSHGLGLLTLCLSLYKAWSQELGTTSPSSIAYCQPHCDASGFYQQGKWCFGDHRVVYCCGSLDERYCCFDSEDAVDYPPIAYCPKSNWWFYQRLIVGMLTSVIIVLVMAACCYYCCSAESYRNSRQSDQGDAELSTIPSDNPNVGTNHFDPESPFAFMPPSYDSLPKDPPHYQEIFGVSAAENSTVEQDVVPPVPIEGRDNPSFVSDNQTVVPAGETNNCLNSALVSDREIPQLSAERAQGDMTFESRNNEAQTSQGTEENQSMDAAIYVNTSEPRPHNTPTATSPCILPEVSIPNRGEV